MEKLTQSVFEKLYYEELLTETEIAERFGTYQVKIGRMRKAWGLPALGKTGRATRRLPEPTERQGDILVGSLLGDGWMDASSALTARFNEGHSLKQEGYLRWKADELVPYVSNVIDVVKTDRVTGKQYPAKVLYTQSCTHLRPFYDLFYKTGARVFPADLPQRMNPLVLAVWFMDDGSLLGNMPRITFGLDDLSWRRAEKALRKLKLKPDIHEDNDGTFGIHFPRQADLFFDLVRPHMPECMVYKLPKDTERRRQDRNAKRLTSTMVRDLHEGGMSMADIARHTGVGVSTVRRRLGTSGGPKRMGPARKYTLKAAEVALRNYDPAEWPTLEAVEQQRWVDEILSVLRRSPFPAEPPMGGEQAQRELEGLRELAVGLEDDEIRPKSWRCLRMCASYFPNRYKATRGTQRSAWEAWHLDQELRKAIEYQLRVGDPVVPYRVLRAVTMNCRTPSVFRPVYAKYLYQTYAPGGVVWDPCAGYGGRLVGAMAAGVRYIGTDVEPETVEGNGKLVEVLGGDHEVHLCGAEKFDPPKVDFVFTSPPYYDRERYSSRSEQSYKGRTVEAWLDEFLCPVIEKAYAAAPVLAINIADLRTRKGIIPLEGRTVDLAKKVGFSHVDTLRMPLAKLNRAKEHASEPVLVFRR